MGASLFFFNGSKETMAEIVYSSQRTGFQKGRSYQNPRFFDGVIPRGTTSAVIVGDWPKVKVAYEKADIPVVVVDPGQRLPNTVTHVEMKEVPQDPDDYTVAIPENFHLLNASNLRDLVAKIDPEADVKNKREAIEFITAYKETL